MRGILILTLVAAAALGKQAKHDSNTRSLRKASAGKAEKVSKRLLSEAGDSNMDELDRMHPVEDEEYFVPAGESFNGQLTSLFPKREGGLVNAFVGPTGVLSQLAGVITSTGQDLLDTAVQGNRLLKTDAQLTLGSVASPLAQGLREGAGRLTDTTRNLVGGLGVDQLKGDAKKFVSAAADVVRQGESNLTGVIRDLIPQILASRQ